MARRQEEEAETCFRKALGLAERLGNPPQLWKTHLALGRLYRDTRKPDLARSSLAASRKAIGGIGRACNPPEPKKGFERSSLIREVRQRCSLNSAG